MAVRDIQVVEAFHGTNAGLGVSHDVSFAGVEYHGMNFAEEECPEMTVETVAHGTAAAAVDIAEHYVVRGSVIDSK